MSIVEKGYAECGVLSHLAVAALLLAPFPVLADSDHGFYLGFGGHQSEVDSSQLSDTETGFHGALGYRFNRFMGAELGLYHLGDFSESALVGPVSAQAEFDGWATGIALVPRLPIWVFDLYAKLGVAYYDVKATVVTSVGGRKEDETNVNGYGALGGSVNIGRRWSVYLEYSRFYTQERVDTAGIGARFHLD